MVPDGKPDEKRRAVTSNETSHVWFRAMAVPSSPSSESGTGDGDGVGWGVGRGVGWYVGAGVGCAVGSGVGCAVGSGEGCTVGSGVGAGVGSGVGSVRRWRRESPPIPSSPLTTATFLTTTCSSQFTGLAKSALKPAILNGLVAKDAFMK